MLGVGRAWHERAKLGRCKFGLGCRCGLREERRENEKMTSFGAVGMAGFLV